MSEPTKVIKLSAFGGLLTGRFMEVPSYTKTWNVPVFEARSVSYAKQDLATVPQPIYRTARFVSINEFEILANGRTCEIFELMVDE